eukprot:14723709-Alexandrium_andersonii.AAC.1
MPLGGEPPTTGPCTGERPGHASQLGPPGPHGPTGTPHAASPTDHFQASSVGAATMSREADEARPSL